MPNVKQKAFRIDDDLALEFEIHAKKLRVKEVDLITRYIREGLDRDSNQIQTTLDEINGEWKIKCKKNY